MSSSPVIQRSGASENWMVVIAATILSGSSLAYCYEHDLLLLYGDAVAHLHIARRIFDSLNPGLRQLGSVWLPLPHLLLLPFVQKMAWWQSGVGGAMPSMVSYVLGSVGIYRLARLWLGWPAASIALLIYALNPGLLYLQTTAMTEPLFLAEMIWAALLIAQACQLLEEHGPPSLQGSRYLLLAGCVLVGAIYTRYDGWIFAMLAWIIVAATLLRTRRWRDHVGGAFLLFTAMLAVAPALWLAYNARQFGDPLDFMRGPYSARAIEQRTAPAGAAHYPGYHSMYVASLHFLKAAEMSVVPFRYGNWLLRLTGAGAIAAVLCCRGRCISAALLLWMPLPFYAYSIAYGSVPIFIPVWWPHSWYNTRYGIEMLPAFALFFAFLVNWLAGEALREYPSFYGFLNRNVPILGSLKLSRRVVAAAFFITVASLVLFDTLTVASAQPLVLQEAIANARTRIPFERALATLLLSLPGTDRILMNTSAHVGALQRAGIPLRRTVNETDYLAYKAAIEQPSHAAAWVVAIDGDAVAEAVARRGKGLELIKVICSTGQPCARLYRSQLGTFPSQGAPASKSLP